MGHTIVALFITHAGIPSRVTNHNSPCAAVKGCSLMNVALRTICCSVLLTACAGCATSSLVDILPPVSYSPSYQYTPYGEGKYLIYDHPFTDAAAESVGKNAERQCGRRRLTAVKVSSPCSLERCTTYFYCMDAADAAQFQTREPARSDQNR